MLVNLYASQLIVFILAWIVLLIQQRSIGQLLKLDQWQTALYWGCGFAAVVIAADVLITRLAPEKIMNDGGVNDRIFRGRAVWHIALISLIVALCEELLFRGAIQHAIGLYWTSILFTVLHIRYLKHWIMTGLVFCISYGLGWIYIQTGTLWAPIIAHFAIDFIMGCLIRFRRDKE
jgi:membrane protease YdiL (CAAX protease family)